eukprot:2636_1
MSADYWLKKLEQHRTKKEKLGNCKDYWSEIELLTKSIAVYERNNFITNLATSKFKMSDQCFNHCFGCIHCVTMVLLQQLTINSSFKYYGEAAGHPIIRNEFVMKRKSVFGKILQSLCLISNSEFNLRNDYVLFQVICAIKPTQMQWIIDSQILTKLLFELNIKRDDDGRIRNTTIFCYVRFILKMIKYKKKKKIVNITDQHKKYCIDASTKLDLIIKQYVSSNINISDMEDLKRIMGSFKLFKALQAIADKKSIMDLIIKQYDFGYGNISNMEDLKRIMGLFKALQAIADKKSIMDLIIKQYDFGYGNISNMEDLKRIMGSFKSLQAIADKRSIVCGNSKCKKNYLSNKYAIIETWENRKVINKWQVCHGCKLTLYCSRRCQKYDWNKGNHRIRCKFSNLYTNVIMSSDYNVI